MTDKMMNGEVGMKKKGRPASKLSDSEVKLIRELRDEGMTYAVLAKKFDVSDTYIVNICKGLRRADDGCLSGEDDAQERVVDSMTKLAPRPVKNSSVFAWDADETPLGEVVPVSAPVVADEVDDAVDGAVAQHVNGWRGKDVAEGVRPVHVNELTSANSTQVGGDHYKTAIQPWDYIAANGIGYFEGNIIKYVSRYKKKNGVEDLKKARHYLDKLIEVVSNG